MDLIAKPAITRDHAAWPDGSREQRHESRGAHSRVDFPDRDDVNWMQHTLATVDEKGKCAFDSRPVHMNTLTTDVEAVPPKKRVY